jgi:hypothetical protein
MNDEMEMKGGSGTKCKPQYSERMLNVFTHIFLHQMRKQLSRILRFQTQQKFADVWLVLTIQTVIPAGLCYLTFVCKNKQGNHAIGIIFLRSCVSEKFSIIDPL